MLSAVLPSGVHAQPTAPAAGAPEEPILTLEAFVTSERGASRATNTIAAKDLKIALPGVNPIKLLQNTPGVNIQSSDPFGFGDEGGTIRVRSFNIGVVAVTVDDVPMGSNSGRYGTPAGRIVDTENLTSITVNQGSGDVTTPAFEALGGAIKYYTKNPDKEAGVYLSQTFGRWDYKRTFARVETGEIVSGLTAFISTSQLTFKTLGMPEESEGRKIDAKIRYELPKTTIN